MKRLRMELRLVFGDDIETTDAALLDALRRAHAGEDPEDLLAELARSGEDDPE